MSIFIRPAVLLLGLVLVSVAAACNVQIAEDGTFKVYGTDVTPYPQPISELDSCTARGGTLTSDGSGCTTSPGAQTPTPVMMTPTPIYDGKLSDWNISGVEHVEATATPRPTPTAPYQEGELILVGNGPISIDTFTVPRGRYNVKYRITSNDDHTYCITYISLSVGCFPVSIGNIDAAKRVTIDSHGALSVEIAPEARYTLVFERVD